MSGADEPGLAWWQRQMRHLIWTPKQAAAIGVAAILLVLAVMLILAVT